MHYIIEGGKKLSGQVTLSGNKNSVLPCMAAALLTEDEIVLSNVPDITDVDVFTEIFKKLGIGIKRKKDKIYIKAKKILETELPDELVKKLRASILLAGPIFARKRKVSFTFPGGDKIGKRSIDIHLQGFKSLGAIISKLSDVYFISKAKKNPIKKIRIFLGEASVTATENLILASVLSESKITIRNAATEPHVYDLCKLLNQMGAKINGVGTNSLKKLTHVNEKSLRFRVSDDHINFGTYAIASAITNSKLKIICDKNTDLEPVIEALGKFGIKFDWENNGFLVFSERIVCSEKIVTNIWPGFPTDLMSSTIVLASQAEGSTLCHDWMFEKRMEFVKNLIKMGADISIIDSSKVFVKGKSNLSGHDFESSDLRSGMALVLAALIAKGVSTINNAELIERGYEDVAGSLSSLGANIKMS